MTRRFSQDSELKAILRRPYWHAEDAECILAALVASGQPVAAFARQHGVHPSRLERWRARLKATGAVAGPRFFPVRLVAPIEKEPEAGNEIELVLAGGRRIIVRRGFDASVLEALVKAVESWVC